MSGIFQWYRAYHLNATLNHLHALFSFKHRWALTSGGLILNASAIFAYNSLTLANPSILPVGLPCASCVWNTSLGRRLAGGGGSPAPFTVVLVKVPAPALPSSLSTKCSFVDLFFFFHGPSGIFVVVLVCFSTWKNPSRCYNIEVANLLSSKPSFSLFTSFSPLFPPSFLPSSFLRTLCLSSPAHSSGIWLCSSTGSRPSLANYWCEYSTGRWWVWDKLWHNLLAAPRLTIATLFVSQRVVGRRRSGTNPGSTRLEVQSRCTCAPSQGDHHFKTIIRAFL